MKIKVTILKLDKTINRPIIRLTNNRPLLFKIYYYTILQLRILLFFITGGKRGNIVMGKLSFQDMLDEACLKFGTTQVKKQRKDILACYVLYGIDPTEYFLYHFDKKDHDSRREFLSDRERMFGCVKMMSWKTFEELKEKDVFYHLASKFFNRDVCIIKSKANKKDFNAFVTKHPIFFGKPITGTLGVGADIYCISKYNNNEDAFEYFLTKGFWILEEIIKQDAEMASFNESSVNTIRIPSFITKKGEHVILNPTIRTGRKGSVVDNAGAGGITAMIDIKTEQCIACGDGFNDISMLKYAGLGVAMSNAKQPVKDAADYITLSNDEDGIAHLLKRLNRIPSTSISLKSASKR